MKPKAPETHLGPWTWIRDNTRGFMHVGLIHHQCSNSMAETAVEVQLNSQLKSTQLNLSSDCRCPLASFTKEVKLRLAKRPLKTNGGLANLKLTY